jgi:mono/diheme cytochrome c family protein
MTRRALGGIIGIWLVGVGLALGCDRAGAQSRERLVSEGRQLFTEKGCYGCHTIGAAGTPIAPDLTHAGARHGEAVLARWLRDPAAQAPTRHMPNLQLSELEASALAAYLTSLR